MDWPLENAELTDSDLAKVFRYAPRETTVIRLLTTDQVGSSRCLIAHHIDREPGTSTMVACDTKRLGDLASTSMWCFG
jgi:hypothetical protein